MHIQIEPGEHVTLRAHDCVMRLDADGTITLAARDHGGTMAEVTMGPNGIRMSDGSASVLLPKG